MVLVDFHIHHASARAHTAALSLLLAGFVTLGTACGGSQSGARRDADSPRTSSTAPNATSADVAESRADTSPVSPPAGRRPQTRPATITDAERALEKETTLATVMRVALARNPDIAEARGRATAAREMAPSVSRLPDPEFEYQLWGQPLARPYTLGDAQMHMFGLRQTFPAPGTLGARSDAAAAEASVAAQARRSREQELVARVRRAYAEYYRADREYRIHLEHGRLAQMALDTARALYQGGRGTQQDVLRAIVELSRLHNDVVTVDANRRSARALLNTLMARPANAPLGPPASIDPSKVQVRIDELSRRLTDQRPEIAAAESAIRARESEVDAARSAGRWPSFMVGVQYMYMPPMEDPHNYGVTLGMSLPWFNPRYGEEVRAAEARLAAERSALSSVRYAARYELEDAAERLRASRESLTIIDRDLLPQAQQSFESAQAAYRGGQSDSLALFDALRSLLEVRIERERALSRVEAALADVERAIGGPIASPRTTEQR